MEEDGLTGGGLVEERVGRLGRRRIDVASRFGLSWGCGTIARQRGAAHGRQVRVGRLFAARFRARRRARRRRLAHANEAPFGLLPGGGDGGCPESVEEADLFLDLSPRRNDEDASGHHIGLAAANELPELALLNLDLREVALVGLAHVLGRGEHEAGIGFGVGRKVPGRGIGGDDVRGPGCGARQSEGGDVGSFDETHGDNRLVAVKGRGGTAVRSLSIEVGDAGIEPPDGLEVLAVYRVLTDRALAPFVSFTGLEVAEDTRVAYV
jgi:hypothetical protein